MKTLTTRIAFALLAALALAACESTSPASPSASSGTTLSALGDGDGTLLQAAKKGGTPGPPGGGGGGGGGGATMAEISVGFDTDGVKVPMQVAHNNKKKLGISGEGILLDINFGNSILNLNACTPSGGSTITNADLLATFSLQNTTRSFSISIDKTPPATGNIVALPAVEDDPTFGENWLSLCFSTGGFCAVTVEDIVESSEVVGSRITFPGGGNSKVRVVDRLGVNDLDILVCPNNQDVVIEVTPSIGWTTS